MRARGWSWASSSTALDIGTSGADNVYGYGRIDALAAYQWLSTAPDYVVAVHPGQATTVPGGTAAYTVDVSAVNGFTGDVTLSLSGLPAGQASWSFSPPIITAGAGSSTLNVTTASTIVPGTYP